MRTHLLRALALLALLPGGAAADGLPVGGIDAGPAGIPIPGDPDSRYVTLNTGRDTIVARASGGRIVRHIVLRGSVTLPAVALDGTPDGLAPNTLVLLRPRRTFPQRATRLVVLDVPRLRVRRRITLRGDYSFDAISPDARTAYVVHYTSPRDPTRYEVRALDLRTGGLRPGRIVDKREPDEEMRGYPLSRVWSPDRRWAYTLYDGANGHPFIHALDTVAAEARCIDLHELEGRQDIPQLRLELGFAGRTLAVRNATGPVVRLETRSWQPAARVSWLAEWLGAALTA